MPTTVARAKRPILAAVVAFFMILGLICLSVVILKKVFAAGVTKANAQMVFDAFDAAMKNGKVTIRDGKFAAELAVESFRKQTDSAPLDGWGRQMRVTAKVADGSCTVTVRSAGADNVFETADDVVCEQTFDLTGKGGITGPTATQPAQ